MLKLFPLSLFIVLFMSCKNGSKIDYTVSTPGGWLRVDSVVDKKTIAFFKSPTNDTDSFIENINIQ